MSTIYIVSRVKTYQKSFFSSDLLLRWVLDSYFHLCDLFLPDWATPGQIIVCGWKQGTMGPEQALANIQNFSLHQWYQSSVISIPIAKCESWPYCYMRSMNSISFPARGIIHSPRKFKKWYPGPILGYWWHVTIAAKSIIAAGLVAGTGGYLKKCGSLAFAGRKISSSP